jgi:MFS family permease
MYRYLITMDFVLGTHLYVLYESYGFSVASLYSLGFVTGAVTTPITGPLVDKFGRKASVLIYCILEIGINLLEQYPFLAGLILSRMVGGVTTNLLSSVFETWLDTEYRRRGLDAKQYELIIRDAVVVSNMAAIASGYLAHVLAENFGPVGPFQGAVSCTALALVVIMSLWTENYGTVANEIDQQQSKAIHAYVSEAWTTFRTDSRILRVGIIQGLTVGSLQLFIFLWSPTLQTFSKSASTFSSLGGLDNSGEPAYGLIFGAFMAAGVAGGLCSSYLRQITTLILSPLTKTELKTVTIEGEGEVRPMAVELLAASCYIISALLMCVPCMLDEAGTASFSTALGAFLVYEFLVGVIMPCEGVIRSLYLPSDARATMMTLPRIIVNLAVSFGVILTRSIR